jgi:SM-20-related protein
VIARLQTPIQPALSAITEAADTHAARLAPGIAGDFLRQGWAIRENFLDDERRRELAAEARQLWERGAFHKAGVGRRAMHRVHAGVRGDFTLWLDAQVTPIARRFVASELEALRRALNASAYLGLFEFEGHLAVYPPGTGYERHVDQLRGTSARRVSVVVYLNDDWKTAEGGELCLYPVGRAGHALDHSITVPPVGGTLAVFGSADMLHEVRPATRTRFSLSGWFRCRT